MKVNSKNEGGSSSNKDHSNIITPEDFEKLINQSLGKHHLSSFLSQDTYACAVSGGPDSLALAYLLYQWCMARDKKLHAVIVDHGLRQNSQEEAFQVYEMLQSWESVTPQILTWEHKEELPQARIMELARENRYRLIMQYCDKHQISYVFVAHHLDDQAETFLMRLTKGSGLDGLCGLKSLSLISDSEEEGAGCYLFRPLLSVTKKQLVATCENYNLSFFLDPSNKNEKFLRTRLRQACDVLEAEGLSNKRLAKTAERLARVKNALDRISAEAFDRHFVKVFNEHYRVSLSDLRLEPEEIIIRTVQKAINAIADAKNYPVRMEKLEALVHKIQNDEKSFKQTLGGCIFTFDRKNDTLTIEKEYRK